MSGADPKGNPSLVASISGTVWHAAGCFWFIDCVSVQEQVRIPLTAEPIHDSTQQILHHLHHAAQRQHFACGLLAATGVAGKPESYFHVPSLARWMETHSLAWDDYGSDRQRLQAVFDTAIQKGTAGTGVFGLRLQRDSFDYFMSQLAELHPDPRTDVDRIEAAFGPTLFIYLTRANKLKQAISRVKAEKTGLWHKTADGQELERLSEPREPTYDPAAINRHISNLTALDDAWRNWFASTGITPHEVSYDDLSCNPGDTLAGILEALGLDKSLARTVDIPTERLSDEVSRSWTARYRREYMI